MTNEKRLIDANEARKHSTHDIITHFLDRCPTVDAVEVVRCKDCKEIASCRIREVGFFTEDGYCQYGERRTDG